jgi:hypothetical protein
MSGGFYGGFFPWVGGGGNGGQQSSGHRGHGRWGNHPDRQIQGPRGGLGCTSLEDEGYYDLANDGREFQGGQYSQRRNLSEAEYEAWQQAVFQPLGPCGQSQEQRQMVEVTRGGITTPPTPSVTWLGQQGAGLPPAANIQGLPGQQGVPGPPGIGGLTSAAPAPQAQATGVQQGGAQIGGQPPGGQGGPGTGATQATAGRAGNVPTPQDYSGISSALKQLSQIMMDADTSRILCWQKEVSGDTNKLAAWKVEAISNPCL